MRVCVKGMHYVTQALFAVSAVLIAAATGFAAFNAITRFFLDLTFNWAEELCTYCVVLMVYLVIARLEFTGDQLCITAIDLWVKNATAQRVLNYIRGILTGAALTILGWHGISVMLKAFKRHQVTYILRLPKGILYAVALGCLAITVLVWLVLMICNKGDFEHD